MELILEGVQLNWSSTNPTHRFFYALEESFSAMGVILVLAIKLDCLITLLHFIVANYAFCGLLVSIFDLVGFTVFVDSNTDHIILGFVFLQPVQTSYTINVVQQPTGKEE